MPTGLNQRLEFRPNLNFTLLCVLLATVWLAGGASRSDVMGQVVVRGAACGTLVIAALWGTRPDWRSAQAPVLFLLAAAALVLAQLAPLPPSIWQALPGRAILSLGPSIVGELQPWRTIAIVPGPAVNALFSLIVPFAVLVLTAGLQERERGWLPGLLLLMIVVSNLVGLLQFSGAIFDYPFINDTPGDVSGNFANRNHFALLLAIGCVLVPIWASPGERRTRWRLPIAFGLVLLFVLTILAIGSRMGMLVGTIALAIGMLLVRRGIQRELRHAPRWVFPAILIGILAALVIFVLLSVAADRAESIHRLFTLDAAQDRRANALPTVLTMIGTYFPAGSGFGGFDPLFRMREPFQLLEPSYFNHAHNDFLEIALDGGLAGILLLGVGIAWWLIASIRAWRGNSVTGRLGSAILLLILIASISDYPARTPIMMAIVVMAGVWLGGPAPRTALPVKNQHL